MTEASSGATEAGGAAGRWAGLAAASAARAAVGFQFQSLPAQGPALAAGLGLSLSQIGTLTGLYMLPGVAAALLAGALLQRVGARETLLAALAAMTLGAALGAFAEGFGLLAASRLLAGFGGVVVTVAGLKALYDLFPERELPLVNALAAAAQPFGMGCALLIFSLLGAQADWSAGLLGAAGVAAAALAAALLLMPRAPVSAAGSEAQPLRAALRFPREEAVRLALAGLTAMFYVGCFYAFLSLFPAYLHARGWGPAEAGLLLGLFGWAPVAIAPAGGWLLARLRRPILLAAPCMLAWGAATLLSALHALSDAGLFAMLVFGPLPLGYVMSLGGRTTAPERRGLASGIFMAAFFLGAAAFPALAAWIGDLSAGAAPGSGEAVAIAVCGAAFMVTPLPLALFEARARRA